MSKLEDLTQGASAKSVLPDVLVTVVDDLRDAFPRTEWAAADFRAMQGQTMETTRC